MPLRMAKIVLQTAQVAVLAAAGFLLPAPPVAAFSQIGAEDGSTQAKEGIVAVPLPPLGGDESGATAPVARDGVGPSVPARADPISPAAPAPSSSGGPEGVGTTDEGETETVPDETRQEGPAAGESAPAADEPDAPEPSGGSKPEGGTSPSTETGEPSAETGGAPVGPSVGPVLAAAEIFRGEEGLPAPVRDLRHRLMEIARAGEIEALRPYIETGEEGTILTFGGLDGDPIDFMKSASGDGAGVEVLAILLEVLQAGHIRSEPGTDNEIFVWPYFTGVPIDTLTKPQQVELFEIVTAGDYQEMIGFGAYNFYRLGISPDGRLQFFVAGD